MAFLLGSVGLVEESEENICWQTDTRQLHTVLSRYGHGLGKAATKKLQALKSELIFLDVDFLVAAFKS